MEHAPIQTNPKSQNTGPMHNLTMGSASSHTNTMQAIVCNSSSSWFVHCIDHKQSLLHACTHTHMWCLFICCIL